MPACSETRIELPRQAGISARIRSALFDAAGTGITSYSIDRERRAPIGDSWSGVRSWAVISLSREFVGLKRCACSIFVTDHQDRRPVEDILWTDGSYQAVYAGASLRAIQVYKPLAKGDEPYSWMNETSIPSWVTYVLKRTI